MIKIALLSPKGPLYTHRGGIFKKSLRYSPLTLPTLAALIPDDVDHELRLIDEGVEEIPLDLEADIIGMTVITGSAKRCYELADHYRARGITVVLGGPHITLTPEDAEPHADALVVGYSEDTWPELLRDFHKKALKLRYSQAADLDLAGRPFARRELMDTARYANAHVFEATRGCIHGCDFCVVPFAWGRKPYQKPVEEVVEEIRLTGARRAIFIDLNIIADKAYAMDLFEALIPLNIEWGGLATVLIAKDQELLELAARSGCIALLVGFESILESSLRDIHKGFNKPTEFKEIMEAFHQRGISIMGTFTFGADHDTPDVFRKTAEFSVEAKIDLPRYSIMTPFPGTALYKRLKAEGRLLHEDWELYDGQHAVFKPALMSAQDLEAGNELAWKMSYRYTSIFKRMSASPSAKMLYWSANLGYRFYANNLSKFYTCDWPLLDTLGTGAAPRLQTDEKGAL